MSTAIESDIITQDERTRLLSGEDQSLLDEFEAMLHLIRDRTRSVAERYQVGAYPGCRVYRKLTLALHPAATSNALRRRSIDSTAQTWGGSLPILVTR